MLFSSRFLWATLLCILFILLADHRCYSQNESQAGISVSKTDSTTIKDVLDRYIKKIDSVGNTTGVAGHFARIYKISMGNINTQLLGKDIGAQNFIRRFEIAFINYFLEAAAEFEKGRSAGPVWDTYFSNPGAESWQLTLMGINAHVNGDIWKGLATNFSEQDIRRYKKDIMSFQTSISKAYQPLFDELMAGNSYLEFINNFTKGSAKQYGEWLIYKWRLRQIKLAILFHNNPEKFKRKLAIVNRKKKRIDKVILRKKKFL